MTPTASVVVPAFNSYDYVETTIDSILSQTFTDYELVIADHSSTDGTWDLLSKYSSDPRVTLFRTPAGGGAPANWAAATALATGRYLKLVCDDDLLAPTCLAEQIGAIEGAQDIVMVASRRALIDASGKTLKRSRGLGGLSGRVEGRTAVRRSVLCGTNIFGEPGGVLLRRTTFEAVGGWDSRSPYVIDQATYANVLMHGDLYAIPKSLASFRIRPDQWSAALVAHQAQQVVAFHHRVAADNPELLSEFDLLWGDALARVTALARRSAYAWLSRPRREGRD